MSNRIPTLEEAEAIFVRSMSHLVTILGLTIIIAALLSMNGMALQENMIDAVRRIIMAVLWIMFLTKILRIIEKLVDSGLEERKVNARYSRG